jgi:hypothetical protein
VVTDATVAVNEAVDAPDATDTLAGTVTAPLLLETAMFTPLDGAAALKDAVHAVVPAPVNVLVAHRNELRVGEVDPDALNCSARLFDEPLALAVSVAV